MGWAGVDGEYIDVDRGWSMGNGTALLNSTCEVRDSTLVYFAKYTCELGPSTHVYWVRVHGSTLNGPHADVFAERAGRPRRLDCPRLRSPPGTGADRAHWPGERWVTIWSRWPIERLAATGDPERRGAGAELRGVSDHFGAAVVVEGLDGMP